MNKPARMLWLPAAVMLLIFIFSSQSYEQQSIKRPLTEWLGDGRISRRLSQMTIHYGSLTVNGKTDGSAAIAEFLLRKCAHLLEYSILGFCLIWAVQSFLHAGFMMAVLATLLTAAGYASMDEFHQIFVKDRGPHPEDILLDTGGALIGICLYAGWRKLRVIRQSRPDSGKGRP
ncbi:VanZ family protein [Paenibacillus pinistramenti]|uniref:VanZ family protein n=1 Tax=Paenibacillus pinistramenti TaxID=1768003 RepID=UPI0011093C22|nr:VanZ family protein [Paenibacillus pinistramenti]